MAIRVAVLVALLLGVVTVGPGVSLSGMRNLQNFSVEIDRAPVSDMISVSGGGFELQVAGELSITPLKLPRTRYENLVLKRGTTRSKAFFDWIELARTGRIERAGGKIVLSFSDETGDELRRHEYFDCLPVDYCAGIAVGPCGEPEPAETVTVTVGTARYYAFPERGAEEPVIDGCVTSLDADGDGLGLDTGWQVLDVSNCNVPGSFQKRPGQMYFSDVTIKGPFVKNREEMLSWTNALLDAVDSHDMAAVRALRRNLSLKYSDSDGTPIIEWTFEKGWPCRYEGPRFDTRSSVLAVEVMELKIEHAEFK